MSLSGPSLIAWLTARMHADPARRAAGVQELADYCLDAARVARARARECRRRAGNRALSEAARAALLGAASLADEQAGHAFAAVDAAPVEPPWRRRLLWPAPAAAADGMPTGAAFLYLVGAIAYPDQDRRQACLYDLCEYVRGCCWSTQAAAKRCRAAARTNRALSQAECAAMHQAYRLANKQATLAWRAAAECQPPPPHAVQALLGVPPRPAPPPPRRPAATARPAAAPPPAAAAGGRGGQPHRGGPRLVPRGSLARRGGR